MKKVQQEQIQNRQILEICAVELFRKIERKKFIEEVKKIKNQ